MVGNFSAAATSESAEHEPVDGEIFVLFESHGQLKRIERARAKLKSVLADEAFRNLIVGVRDRKNFKDSGGQIEKKLHP
jgi:hypothetical protein